MAETEPTQPSDDLPNDRAAASPQPLLSLNGTIGGDARFGDVAQTINKTYNTYGPVASRDGSPFSAPYSKPDQTLIGRDALIDTIRSHLLDPDKPRLALTGLPGAGKTRL